MNIFSFIYPLARLIFVKKLPMLSFIKVKVCHFLAAVFQKRKQSLHPQRTVELDLTKQLANVFLSSRKPLDGFRFFLSTNFSFCFSCPL